MISQAESVSVQMLARGIWIPITKIRWSRNRLILVLELLIISMRHSCIEMARVSQRLTFYLVLLILILAACAQRYCIYGIRMNFAGGLFTNAPRTMKVWPTIHMRCWLSVRTIYPGLASLTNCCHLTVMWISLLTQPVKGKHDPWRYFYYHGLTFIPARVSNYMHYKAWIQITYPFQTSTLKFGNG